MPIFMGGLLLEAADSSGGRPAQQGVLTGNVRVQGFVRLEVAGSEGTGMGLFDSFKVTSRYRMEEARRDGLRHGWKEGHDKGVEEGKRQGYRLGYEQGYEKGKLDGSRNGRREGVRAGLEQGHEGGKNEGR